MQHYTARGVANMRACYAFGMRTGTFVLAASLAVAACGDADQEKSDYERLAGTWFVDMPDAYKCVVGMTFDAQGVEGAYEHDLLCELTSGGWGMAVDVGTWNEVGDNEIQLYPKQSSCPDAPVLRYKFDFVGKQLRMASNAELLLLDSTEGPGGPSHSVAVTFGCFNGAAFTPSPLHGLP